MRTKIIAGNWKMFKTNPEAKQLVESGFEYVCDIESIKLFRKRK